MADTDTYSEDTYTDSEDTYTDSEESESPFPFLKLPQELQDEVYELVSDVTFFRMPATANGPFLSDSELQLTCKEVRRGFGNVLRRLAPVAARVLVCEVQDFNFKHLIKFLNRVIETANFSDFNELTGNRKLYVNLSVSTQWNKLPDGESLGKWAKWVNVKTKKGFAFKVRYSVKNVENRKLTKEVLGRIVGKVDETSELHHILEVVNRDDTEDDNDDEEDDNHDKEDDNDYSNEDYEETMLALAEEELEKEMKDYNVEKPGMISSRQQEQVEIFRRQEEFERSQRQLGSH